MTSTTSRHATSLTDGEVVGKFAVRAGDPDVLETAQFDDPHKFAVEAQSPAIGVAVGSARLARAQYSPALNPL